MKAVQAYDPSNGLMLKSKDAVIHFEEGLIGFSEYKDFVLLENEGLAPFRLLQSIVSSDVGFLVIEPTMLVDNYHHHVPARDWESVELGVRTNPLIFVIAVIGATPENSTGNLQAPLLINYEKMIGKQVILTDSGFSVRHPLV
jgi:flagellar assembly factor FliW